MTKKHTLVDTADLPPTTAKKCGIVMPISATASNDAQHWRSVLSLIERTISSIDDIEIVTSPVWKGENNDRISERIIGNIFSSDIVIADISDLNPNVMIEVGFRLSSKKPTIIICDNTTNIPFDIKDMKAIIYPNDLNIIDMEAFFKDLKESAIRKLKAFDADSYIPFLENIIIEVAEPKQKNEPIMNIILDRIDNISSRISNIENRGYVSSISTEKFTPLTIPTSRVIDLTKKYDYTPSFRQETNKSIAYYTLPRSAFDILKEALTEEYTGIRYFHDGSVTYLELTNTPARSSESSTEKNIKEMIEISGGKPRAHRKFVDMMIDL